MVVMFALLVAFGRYIIPNALDKVAKQRNKDAFLMLTLLSVVLAAYLTNQAGLSMALGGFLMGMFLSTSKYSFQIESCLEPFKGILMSLFFIAVGMSIDFRAILDNPLLFSGHIVVILVLKAVVVFGLVLAFGGNKSGAIKLAFLLNQSGEFGFVLFGAAKGLNVIDDTLFVVGIGVISISMLLTLYFTILGVHLPIKSPIYRNFRILILTMLLWIKKWWWQVMEAREKSFQRCSKAVAFPLWCLTLTPKKLPEVVKRVFLSFLAILPT